MLYDPNWKPVEIPVKKAKKKKEKSKRKTWRTLMLDAAKVLKTHGWIRGSLKSGDGFCTIGALMQADAGNTEGPFSKSYYQADRQLKNHLNTSVTNWNDRVAAEAKDVISTLRKVAKQNAV